MGYTTGASEVTMQAEDGAPATRPGRFVAVWRRGADGEWRGALDILMRLPRLRPVAPAFRRAVGRARRRL